MSTEPELVTMLRRMGYQEAWLAEKLPERLLTWSDDEIVDDILRPPTSWTPSKNDGRRIVLSLHDQRMLAEALRDYRKIARPEPSAASPDPATPTVPEATRENVTAERERRIRDREPFGADSLAPHFSVSESTIRRRLGTLK